MTSATFRQMGPGEPLTAQRAAFPTRQVSTPSGRRVLVVDDLEDVRHLITQVLKRRQYTLRQADNGRAALESLREYPADLVITDLNMPEMNGLELLEQVKALYPDTDVIVLTAYGTIQSAVRAMQQGAFDFATKPFDIREIEEKVSRCFQQRDSRNQPRSPIQPLVELSRILTGQTDLVATLDAIVELIQRTFSPDYAEITLLNEALPDGGVMLQRGEAMAGSPLLRPTREEMEALAKADEPWALWHGGADGHGASLQAGSAVLTPLVHGQAVGAVLLMRKAGQPLYSRDQAQLLHLFASQIALAVLHAHTHQQVADAFRGLQYASLSAVQTLVEALGTFDHYTQGHSDRVSRYAQRLAMALELPGPQVEAITMAGLLHDLGKLGVGDSTLRKNGQLTADEFNRVKLHPVMGAKILAGVKALAHVVPLVRHHHEAMDGHGYPDGLAGDAIPLGARIIAVADAYDSMVTDRPYRRALPQHEALERLAAAAGTQLDGALVAKWTELVARHPDEEHGAGQ